jgi:hypothetical protein
MSTSVPRPKPLVDPSPDPAPESGNVSARIPPEVKAPSIAAKAPPPPARENRAESKLHSLQPDQLAQLESDIAAAQMRYRRRFEQVHRSPPPPPTPPTAMTDAPARTRSRWRIVATTAGIAVAASSVTLLALGKFPSTDQWKTLVSENTVRHASSPVGSYQPAADSEKQKMAALPRLVVEGASSDSGDVILLGAKVEGPADGLMAMISGLAPGTALSAGKSWGSTGWIVPASELAKIYIRPPQGFSGGMEYTIALRSADAAIVDMQTMRLEWPAIASPATPAAKPRPEPISPATPAAKPRPEPASPATPAAKPRPEPASPATPAAKPQQKLASAAPAAAPQHTVVEATTNSSQRLPDAEEIARLLKRGEQLFEQGDIAGARLVLQRAAEARDARAALLLAGTFDPIVLEKLGVYGFSQDIAKARSWYQRAKEYGSTDAPRRLEELVSRSR